MAKGKSIEVHDEEIRDLVAASQNDETSHLTAKQQALISAYMDPDSPTQFKKGASLKAAGYAPSVSWAQTFPSIRDHIIDRTKDILAESAPEAASILVDYIRDPENVAGGRDRLHAIQLLFDRAGVIKEERIDVKVEHSSVFVLPPKKQQEAVDLDFEEINEANPEKK